MALQSAKYTAIHTQTRYDKDKLKDEFDAGHAQKLAEIPDKEPLISAIMYQIGVMQEELDYLRAEISANKDKTSMTLGTSSNTALAGDTNIVTIGSNTTIAFGDMQSKTVKGKTTYQIIMTVTNGGVSKTITHTLA